MENSWYVITGGPSAGKTACVELLDKMGFRVVYEAARIYIDEELKKGNTVEEIRKDELSFQKKVLSLKIKEEEKLPKNEVIFFDRGIPDSEAYYKLCGEKNNKHLEQAMKNSNYKKVFLLELLDFKKDYARTESREQQVEIQKMLEESYGKSPYLVVRVPKMKSKEKRIEFILKNL